MLPKEKKKKTFSKLMITTSTCVFSKHFYIFHRYREVLARRGLLRDKYLGGQRQRKKEK